MGGKDNAGVTNSPGKFQGLVGFFYHWILYIINDIFNK
mgnify:CR=1 FL=1